MLIPVCANSFLFCAQDWKSHKEYCVKVKAAKNTFDAMLFAVNETKPRLVKIPWKFDGGGDEASATYHDLDKSIWFKQFPFVRTMLVHPFLCFLYDDNFGTNGSPRNGCIDAVTGGKPGQWWGGNILALRKRRSESDDDAGYEFYDNVDMEEDLMPLVKFFERYGKKGSVA